MNKKPLSDLVTIISGGTPKRSNEEYWDGQIQWISVKDFHQGKHINHTEESITESGLMNSSTNLLEKDDIIISARGTVGLVSMIVTPMAFNQSIFGLRVQDELTPEYLYYWLKLNIPYIKNNVHGSVFDTITRDTFKIIEVSYPSLEEQEKATESLRLLDSKIEMNTQLNDNLLELASELVNHSSQTQGRETTPLNDVLSSEKVVSKTVQGLDPNTYISTTNMLPGKAGVTSDVDLPASGKAKMYKPGDILIANIRPYFKKIWFSDKSGSYSNDVLNFRANEGIVSREFLWGLLYSDDFFDYVVATSKGTKMPRGDKDAIAKYELRLPDYKEVQRITKVISPMLEMVSLNNLEIINLTQTRDAFLSNLID